MVACIKLVQFIRILTLRPFVSFVPQSLFEEAELESGDFRFSLMGKDCAANASMCAESAAVSEGL